MLATSLVLLSATALTSSVAEAGGLGLLGTGGIHGDRVYYYTQNSIGEYEQKAPMDQLNPNLGGGLEVLIGDKDYKINGIFRFYYLQDGPLQAPGSHDTYTFNIREDEWKPIGMIDAGLHFGLVGDPSAFQLVAIAMVGSGFMTSDQTEFVAGHAGAGITYTMARHYQIHAEATGGVRYRKALYPMVSGSAGIRYLFD